MKRSHIFPWTLAACLLAASVSATAAAGPAQGLGNADVLCDNATARQIRSGTMPRHLLKAIALAETGRWDKARKANIAWPWTVTAEGQGNYFPDKAQALAFVEELQGRGVVNIDVGCMQVNLYYHGHAFAGPEQAIEPAANVAYAASFLADLYRRTGSWTQAAAHYHSTEPTRARAYKFKVLKYWNAERRQATASGGDHIDHARMADLDARHRAAAAGPEAEAEAVRRGQLAAWRRSQSGGPDLATLSAMRRAALESERRKSYLGIASGKARQDAFAEKRRLQLEKWRRDVAGRS